MANYNSSPQVNAHPILTNATEIVVLSALDFGTGAINTALISDLHAYSKRMLYIDVTGGFTGGMSAPITLSIASRPTNYPAWTTFLTPTITNTAYLFDINPTSIHMSGQWMNMENIKIIVTNPNTGVAGVTNVTATINAVLSVQI